MAAGTGEGVVLGVSGFGDFIGLVFSFPTVLFTFSLVVVIAYWAFVVLGALDLDLLDGDIDVGVDAGAGSDGGSDGGGLSGVAGWLRLGGVPVTVTLSLLIA